MVRKRIAAVHVGAVVRHRSGCVMYGGSSSNKAGLSGSDIPSTSAVWLGL
jgi:hypothetical protein